ncbi:hypothetical protein B0H19DRAFT_1268506 [Mycena capillaripes]|nr:hypothetical protein B0H19DRAFT_1268506 [Mycena capillaripes]
MSSSFRDITHFELLDTHWDAAQSADDLSARLELLTHRYLPHISFNCAPQSSKVYTALRAETCLRYIVFLILHTSEMQNAQQLTADSRYVCVDQRKAWRQD